jgi:tRNA (cytidine/uridine-2'-O-)-methyltransferase
MNVVLIEPEIPPNTGNVARLCAATGATLHLVGPLGFRLDDRELRRAGMDYWEQVTWKYWKSFAELRTEAEANAAFYFVETNAPRLYTEPAYRANDYLVFGRETLGLPKDLIAANLSTTISLPMYNPNARSLNLSNCVAVVLFHSLWVASNRTWTMPDGRGPCPAS